MLNRDPYEVLQLNNNADFAQVEEAYKRLRAQYYEDRFKSGEEGNQGARNLMEVEEAFAELKKRNMRQHAQDTYGSDLGDIDNLVRIGKYEEAQKRLDSINERTAEWHYLQSIVFYKREWLTEAKKQLELAVAKDPDNQKYRTALAKMETVMGNPLTNPDTLGRQQGFGGQGTAAQRGPMDTLCTCCSIYLCTSCCCDCMTLCL